MRGDVLQAGQEERVVVRMVAIVAHQRAAAALRVVELARAETVVDEQQRALFQAACQAVDQAACGEADFADIIVRHVDLLRGMQQGGSADGAFLPDEAMFILVRAKIPCRSGS